MTVPEQIPYVGYIGNGTTTIFPITFHLSDPEYLVVTVNKEIPQTGNYTVDATNGNVIFGVAPASGAQVELYRETQLNRDTEYKSYNNSFRPEIVNYDFDKVWQVLQEQHMIDAEVLARIKAEIEWRRTHDANFDELSKMRDSQIFSGLKQYLDTILAGANPNIFDGVTAGIVFALDKKSVQTHLEEIATDFEDVRTQIGQIGSGSTQAVEAEKQRALLAESNLNTKIDTEKTRALAAESQLSASIGAVGQGYYKSYATLAAANADIANIPLSVSVKVLSSTDGGEYYKASSGATSLTKSPYDPVAIAAADAQAKADAARVAANANTDSNISSVNLNTGFNIVLNAKTSTINETFKSLNNAFIDGVLVYGTLPSDLRATNFPSKSTVDAGITNGTITIRGDGLNFNSAQFNVAAGGEKVEVLFNNTTFVAKFYIDFSKAPTTAVNSNTSGYFFDVSRLNVKQASRKEGYYAKLATAAVKSKVALNSFKAPQLVHNYLNDKFLIPINFYPDLSTTVGSVPTNSNTQDPDYTLSYHLTHASAYTSVTDAIFGEGLKYSAIYGTSVNNLVSIVNIFKSCEVLVRVKIDPSLIRGTSLTVRNGSGGENRYNLFDGIANTSNNTYASATLLENDIDNGYSVWKITATPNLAVNASLSLNIAFRNTSLSSGTFDVSLFSPVVADKINYPFDVPYSKTQNSPFLGKNLMYFGDSNSRGNIAIEMIKNLGCNVYWNAAGGRSMQYRGVSEVETDLGWLYHWTRRSHIKNIKDSGKLLDLFLFNASYNDSSGGGTLSDAAIQAVLDNYPTLQDDADTVTAKLAIFNSLTIAQRKSIFGYKQTFAAYLLQIITMFPTAKIFLTTMLYSPAAPNYLGSTSGTVNEQRATDKAVRDAINADIRLVAQWYGVTVLDAATHAGYYYGNMTNYTSDTIHFNEIIGKRIGYFEAKSILMQTV